MQICFAIIVDSRVELRLRFIFFTYSFWYPMLFFLEFGLNFDANVVLSVGWQTLFRLNLCGWHYKRHGLLLHLYHIVARSNSIWVMYHATPLPIRNLSLVLDSMLVEGAWIWSDCCSKCGSGRSSRARYLVSVKISCLCQKLWIWALGVYILPAWNCTMARCLDIWVYGVL